jgi:hypothetical protein
MAARATGTKKTTPEERENADKDTFAKEFLVFVDDSSKVADEVHERNKVAVATEAIQRGLRPTGEVRVESEDVQDEHNVLIAYSVDVKSAEDTK